MIWLKFNLKHNVLLLNAPKVDVQIIAATFDFSLLLKTL